MRSKVDITIHKNSREALRKVDRQSLGETWLTGRSVISRGWCHVTCPWMHTSSPLTPNPGPHQGLVSTHLLVSWSLGEIPFSPKRVMNTLASVPAPRTSPVDVTTSYTGGGKEKTDGSLREKQPESYMGLEKPWLLPAPRGCPATKDSVNPATTCKLLSQGQTHTKSCCESKPEHFMPHTHFTGKEPLGTGTSPSHTLYGVNTRTQPMASRCPVCGLSSTAHTGPPRRDLLHSLHRARTFLSAL